MQEFLRSIKVEVVTKDLKLLDILGDNTASGESFNNKLERF